MKKTILVLCIFGGLNACSISDHDDLKSWMKNEEKNMKGKIESLPPVKEHVVTSFVAKNNPFLMKPTISLKDLAKEKYAPNIDRKKEPLEEYPIETLKMVGIISKDGITYAMVKEKTGLIHYVAKGNYLGQNYGEVKEVDDGEVVIEERVQETGEWKLRTTRIMLSETAPQYKKKK